MEKSYAHVERHHMNGYERRACCGCLSILLLPLVAARSAYILSILVSCAAGVRNFQLLQPSWSACASLCFGLNYHIAWDERCVLLSIHSHRVRLTYSFRFDLDFLCVPLSVCWLRLLRIFRLHLRVCGVPSVLRCSLCNSRYCCVRWIYDYWHILKHQRLCR